MLAFPNGKHNDPVDALSQALVARSTTEFRWPLPGDISIDDELPDKGRVQR
jgi:hypothetical protein